MLFLIRTKITPLQYTLTLEKTQVSNSSLHTRTYIHMYLKNCHRERLWLRVFILHNTKPSFTLLSAQWCVEGYVTWLTTYVCTSKKKSQSFALTYLNAHSYKQNVHVPNHASRALHLTDNNSLISVTPVHSVTSNLWCRIQTYLLVGEVNYFSNDGSSSLDNAVSTGT